MKLKWSKGCVVVVVSASASWGQDRLIAVDSSRTLYEIDMATAVKTAIGTVSANAGTTSGLARNSSDGTIYLVSTSTDSLYTLDLATGNATLIGAFGDPAIVMHGVEWDGSTGTLYAASSHNGGIYTLNTTTGAATLVGLTGLSGTSLFTNLGYNSITDTMYAAVSSNLDSFYQIDRSTGIATFIGSLAPSTNPNSLTFNPSSGLMYLADNTTDVLYTVNMSTGVTTTVGSTGSGNLLGLVFVPGGAAVCYANCDASTGSPVLTANDFQCFLNKFAAGDSYANCDQSTGNPALTANDFQCFLNKYAAGCS